MADEKRNSVLILLTRGTYGHDDDAIGAILVGNGLLGVKHRTTMLLLDDGVYFVVKNQDPSFIELANNLSDINDFVELGGRMVVHESSLSKRHLTKDELIDGVEIINDTQIIQEIEDHDISMTF
jgi:sulfur relay (sulfurtransferase) DsrF/TusC family protein